MVLIAKKLSVCLARFTRGRAVAARQGWVAPGATPWKPALYRPWPSR